MRFGIALDNFTVPGSAVNVSALIEKAKLAESLGFESVWFWDHLLLGSKTVYPILEPIALISNIAAKIETALPSYIGSTISSKVAEIAMEDGLFVA